MNSIISQLKHRKLFRSMEIAQAKQNQAVETSHILKGMMMVDENVIPYLLKKMNVNMDLFSRSLDKIIESYPKVTPDSNFLVMRQTRRSRKHFL